MAAIEETEKMDFQVHQNTTREYLQVPSEEDHEIRRISMKLPTRHGQVLMLWLALFISYIQRINMSVGIVAMTDRKSVVDSKYPIYNWTEIEKNSILSSFFWGYITLEIAFGPLCQKFGSKLILTISISLTSLFCVAIPFASNAGYIALIVLRILQGVVQGALYPCLTNHVSNWVPPIERMRALSFCFSGSPFAPLFGYPLCGFLASSKGGWPSVFYVPGALGIGWVILWLWIGANTPKDYSTISDAERTYIETAIQHDVNVSRKLKTPWKSILMSAPVQAIAISAFVVQWGYWTLLVQLPIYMSFVLNLDLKQDTRKSTQKNNRNDGSKQTEKSQILSVNKPSSGEVGTPPTQIRLVEQNTSKIMIELVSHRENGLLSSLPYLCASLGTIVYACIASYVTKHCKITKTRHRNIWNTIATWGSACSLLIFSFIDRPSTSVAVLLFMLTVTMMVALFNGYGTNSIDISPNFCGTIQGIISNAANLGIIIGSLCVGWLVKNPTSAEEWKSVFLLTSALMFFGNIFYLFFSSAEVQPWNNGPSSVDDDDRAIDRT